MDKIDELALQSNKECGDFSGSIIVFDYRKFAQLIIQECIDVISQNSDPFVATPYSHVIKQHFGEK